MILSPIFFSRMFLSFRDEVTEWMTPHSVTDKIIQIIFPLYEFYAFHSNKTSGSDSGARLTPNFVAIKPFFS